MPEVSVLLACACAVARYIGHVIHWARSGFLLAVFFQPMRIFQPFSPSPSSPRALLLLLLLLFSPLMFSSVTGACSFPFVWGLMAGLRCCASHGSIISV